MAVGAGAFLTEAAVVQVPDLEVLEDAVDGLPMQIDRLTAASEPVRMSMLASPGMSIATGLTDMPIRSSGGVVDGAIVVGVPLSAGTGSWNGVALREDRAWCYGPGAEHHGVAARPPWWAGVTVDRSLFSGSDQERLIRGASVEIIESPTAGRLSRIVVAAESAALEGMSEARVALLRTDLVEAIAALGDDEKKLTMTAAARLVRQCEVLAPELGPIPAVRALADAVGTSDRWVRSAFSQTYGVAPSEYFRALALARCRRDLEAAKPGLVTVTDVAVGAGFWHLGRFSAHYRAFFGESPSVTLARE